MPGCGGMCYVDVASGCRLLSVGADVVARCVAILMEIVIGIAGCGFMRVFQVTQASGLVLPPAEVPVVVCPVWARSSGALVSRQHSGHCL